MIKGVIMDLDGTLLDSMEIWDSIAENYLVSEGYTPTAELSETIFNMSLLQACEYIRNLYGIEKPVEELKDAIVAKADEFYRYEAQLKPGAAGFLQELHEKDCKICLATANDRLLAEAVLGRNGVLEYFMKIFTCEECGCGKDDPAIFLTVAEHMGLTPDEIMVFEDSLYAVKTAKAAGFHTTAVYDRHEREQEEIQRTAEYYLKGWNER